MKVSTNFPLFACGLAQLRQKAIRAFNRRGKLNRSLRQAFLKAFGNITKGHAWQVVRDFAYGKLTVIGHDLNLLIASWIRLGNLQFRRMVNVLRALKSEIDSVRPSFDGFLGRLSAVLPRRHLSKIRDEMRTIWESEFETVTLTA